MPSHQRYCCICKNHGKTVIDGRKVTMHRFPAKVRNIWIKHCRKARPNFKYNSYDQTRICSDHFVGKKGPTKEHSFPNINIIPQQEAGENEHAVLLDDATKDSGIQLDISDKDEDFKAPSLSDDAFGLFHSDMLIFDVSSQSKLNVADMQKMAEPLKKCFGTVPVSMEYMDMHGDNNARSNKVDHVAELPEIELYESKTGTIKPSDLGLCFTNPTKAYEDLKISTPLLESPMSNIQESLSWIDLGISLRSKDEIQTKRKRMSDGVLKTDQFGGKQTQTCDNFQDILDKREINTLSHYVVAENNHFTLSQIWCLVKQGLRELSRSTRVIKDINPSTIAITKIGRHLKLQITGFHSEEQQHEPIKFKDMPTEYLAPEMLKLCIPEMYKKDGLSFDITEADITGKADVYAFGVVIIYMYLRASPIQKLYTQEVTTSQNVDEVKHNIMKQLAKEPDIIHKQIPERCDPEMKHLLDGMTHHEHGSRLSAKDALSVVEDRNKKLKQALEALEQGPSRKKRVKKRSATVTKETVSHQPSSEVHVTQTHMEEVHSLHKNHSVSQLAREPDIIHKQIPERCDPEMKHLLDGMTHHEHGSRLSAKEALSVVEDRNQKMKQELETLEQGPSRKKRVKKRSTTVTKETMCHQPSGGIQVSQTQMEEMHSLSINHSVRQAPEKRQSIVTMPYSSEMENIAMAAPETYAFPETTQLFEHCIMGGVTKEVKHLNLQDVPAVSLNSNQSKFKPETGQCLQKMLVKRLSINHPCTVAQLETQTTDTGTFQNLASRRGEIIRRDVAGKQEPVFPITMPVDPPKNIPNFDFINANKN